MDDWTYEIVTEIKKSIVRIYNHKNHVGDWLEDSLEGKEYLMEFLSNCSEGYRNCVLIARDELIDRGLIDG